MDKEEILVLVNAIPKSVSQIETELGMPKTTLQKALKGQRALPKRWAIILKEKYKYLPPFLQQNITDLTKPTNLVEPLKPMGEEKSNIVINTGKLPNESSIDYRLRIAGVDPKTVK